MAHVKLCDITKDKERKKAEFKYWREIKKNKKTFTALSAKAIHNRNTNYLFSSSSKT